MMYECNVIVLYFILVVATALAHCKTSNIVSLFAFCSAATNIVLVIFKDIYVDWCNFPPCVICMYHVTYM